MSLRMPPLRATHADRGARFTEFGGWEMPVSFDSIRTEHQAVRNAAGKFDVSHMGEIAVRGPDAPELMGRLTSNDAGSLDPGEGHYAMITDSKGILLDDTVVYRRGPETFLFVPNAGHDEEMADRWCQYRDEWGLDVEVQNGTEEYAMFAIQGPDAPDLVEREADKTVTDLDRFAFRDTSVAGVDCLVSNSGYTGEDGFELLLSPDNAEPVWEAFDCQACGLGARDTLRLEMGFLLSGQDFDPEENPRNPYEAHVGFAVDLETDFVGRDALARVQEKGVEERLVGIELLDRGVPRHGHIIETPDGDELGHITSGTMSPTLDIPIALGYVPIEFTEPDTEVQVEIRDEPKEARIRTTPFL